MADVQLLASGTVPAPQTYTVPGAQEILLKAAFATFDGTGAAGPWVPTLELVAPGGVLAASCPITATLAAGASADVSWFPVGGGGSGGRAVGTLVLQLKVNSDQTLVSTGDGQLTFVASDDMNGLSLFEVAGFVSTVGTTQTAVQIRNASTGFDMLTTAITIDTAKFTSYASAVQPVIDASHALVLTGNLVTVDVDSAGTNAEGLGVVLSFH